MANKDSTESMTVQGSRIIRTDAGGSTPLWITSRC